MSTSSDDKQNPPHRTVKWSPPYRGETVEMPDFDLIEIEDQLIAPDILGQNRAMPIRDLPPDPGFANRHGPGSRHPLAVVVALLDLEIVETRQQDSRTDQDHGGQQVKPESEARFHSFFLSNRHSFDDLSSVLRSGSYAGTMPRA